MSEPFAHETVAMIAHGLDHFRTWPFVTLSSFQERAHTVKELSGVLYVGFSPVVTHANRVAWENYTRNDPEAQWYQDALEYQKVIGTSDLDNRPQVKTDDPNLDLSSGIANYIYDFDRERTGKGVISPEADWYLPMWQVSATGAIGDSDLRTSVPHQFDKCFQTSPVTQRAMVNQNRASNSAGAIDCLKYQEVVIDGMQYSSPGHGSDDDPVTAEIAWLLRLANKERTLYEGDIFSNIYFPVYNSFNSATRESVGIMRAVIHWARYFANVLPASTQGLLFVLENGCDEPFTYRIDGAKVTPIGHGDLHDRKFDDYMRSSTFADVSAIADGTKEGMKLHFDECQYSIRIYPSDHMVESMTTNTPIVITVSVAIVFLFTVLMFFAYDRLVERRQRILMDKAKRTHQIVASLFPKNIREQILNDNGDFNQGGLLGAKNNLKTFVKGGMNDNQIFGQMPIADMYPEATVMFADIAGFTSWSSSREPAQVFVLLQNLYQAFDEIAKKRKVFKVETIGDSVSSVCFPELSSPLEH
eukprot:scaffold6899_cov183-Amphora_coffeaeformis.AAC.3